MAESTTATVTAGEAARLVPTRFAGLQAAPASPPAVPPGPYGRYLVDAGVDEIEAAVRRVWPVVVTPNADGPAAHASSCSTSADSPESAGSSGGRPAG